MRGTIFVVGLSILLFGDGRFAGSSMTPVLAAWPNGEQPDEGAGTLEPDGPLRDFSIPSDPDGQDPSDPDGQDPDAPDDGLGGVLPPDANPRDEFEGEDDWKSELGSQEAQREREGDRSILPAAFRIRTETPGKSIGPSSILAR